MDPTMQFLMGSGQQGSSSGGEMHPFMQLLMHAFSGGLGQGGGASGGNSLAMLLQHLGLGGQASGGGQTSGGASQMGQTTPPLATGGAYNPTAVPQKMPSNPGDMTQQLGAQGFTGSGGGFGNGLFGPANPGVGLFGPPQNGANSGGAFGNPWANVGGK